VVLRQARQALRKCCSLFSSSCSLFH